MPSNIQDIPLDLIDPPETPLRSSLDEYALAELADSIRAHGVLQPILLKPNGPRYLIIAGHRRYLASRIIRATHIPAIIIEPTDDEAALVSLDENTKREQLSYYDEARHLERLRTQLNLSPKELSALVGHSESWVKSRLDLLVFPTDVLDAVNTEGLSLGVAAQLALISDDIERKRLLHYAREDGVSAQTARYWVQMWRTDQPILTQDLSIISKGNPPKSHGEFHYPCKTCGDSTPMSNISTIMICSGCLKVILDIAEEHARSQPNR